MQRGRLIVFEGPDGCGKTTLSKALWEQLCQQGERTVWSSFPGRDAGTLGHLVYQLHHESGQFGIQSLAPIGLQGMHIAAHLDAIFQRLLPLLDAGQSVVLDRYWWSTWAYGHAGQVHASVLDGLIGAEKTAWVDHLPTCVFLVRRQQPIREDYPEKWIALNRAYEELAGKERVHYPVVTVWNESDVPTALATITSQLATVSP